MKKKLHQRQQRWQVELKTPPTRHQRGVTLLQRLWSAMQTSSPYISRARLIEGFQLRVWIPCLFDWGFPTLQTNVNKISKIIQYIYTIQTRANQYKRNNPHSSSYTFLQFVIGLLHTIYKYRHDPAKIRQNRPAGNAMLSNKTIDLEIAIC